MQAVLLHALVVLLFFGGKNVAPASREDILTSSENYYLLAR